MCVCASTGLQKAKLQRSDNRPGPVPALATEERDQGLLHACVRRGHEAGCTVPAPGRKTAILDLKMDSASLAREDTTALHIAVFSQEALFKPLVDSDSECQQLTASRVGSLYSVGVHKHMILMPHFSQKCCQQEMFEVIFPG